MSNDRIKIAVIISNMSAEYCGETLKGIEAEARAADADIYIFNAEASADETIKHNIGEYNIYELVDYSRFDGVILFANMIQGHSVFNKVISQIKEAGVVTVSIDAELDEFYYLGVDNYEPMKAVVNHLIEHHHFTKINYISGFDFNSDSRERLAAYCDAMTEHGLPVDGNRIYKGSFSNEFGRRIANHLLQNPDLMPEAIVCATDSLAVGVRNIFSKHGIDIPRQIALTGFDNVYEARNSLPPLTTVHRNQELVGAEAVKRIVKVLAGEEVPKKERFMAVPIFRASCGCVNEEEESITALRKKYIDTSEHYERALSSSNMMIEDLNDSNTWTEYLQRLESYVGRLECESLYICLDGNLVKNLQCTDEAGNGEGNRFRDTYPVTGYPKTMTVAMAYTEGQFVTEEDFATGDLLPEIARLNREERHTYVFTPLHFRDRCMGYAVVEDSVKVIGNPMYGNWMINVSNGLEQLRKQAHLKSTVERLDKMYVIDSLTGLYNRFGFSRYAGESFSRCVGQNDSFMILFADLDGLKKINDKYGHDDGDVAIAGAAYALKKACKGDEICARMGGDEFVVYAEGYSEGDAVAYCKRLEKQLIIANQELQKKYRVEISYGYEVVFPEVGDTLDKYVDLADGKMYLNKKKKRDKNN